MQKASDCLYHNNKIVTVIYIINYFLNLLIQTNTTTIYKGFNVNDFKYIYNLFVLIQLHKYKHLIPIFNHEHKIININRILIIYVYPIVLKFLANIVFIFKCLYFFRY